MARRKFLSVGVNDRTFPPQLRGLEGCPGRLFYSGDLSVEHYGHSVAVVGTRKPSDRGRQSAYRIGQTLAKVGITVVNGLAAGIDADALNGAMEAGGQVVAVIATGLDLCTPASNTALQERIAQEQLLLSQYPAGTAPNRDHYLARNAVVSGLSRAVVVVEATERSGTSATARLALRQGRKLIFVGQSLPSFAELPNVYCVSNPKELISAVLD